MLANDKKLQKFLGWTIQKANSVQFSYKTVAVRAFYADVEARTLDCACACARNLDLDLALNLNRDRDLNLNRDLALDLDLDLALDLTPVLDLDHALDFTRDRARAGTRALARARARALDRVLTSELGDDVLRQELQALKSQLPSNRDDFYQWWKNHREEWTKQLRQVCIDRRNIGHNWQFTKQQVELLNQYYAANLLLVECMNRSYVSKQVREEIESTMLLPRKK